MVRNYDVPAASRRLVQILETKLKKTFCLSHLGIRWTHTVRKLNNRNIKMTQNLNTAKTSSTSAWRLSYLWSLLDLLYLTDIQSCYKVKQIKYWCKDCFLCCYCHRKMTRNWMNQIWSAKPQSCLKKTLRQLNVSSSQYKSLCYHQRIRSI